MMNLNQRLWVKFINLERFDELRKEIVLHSANCFNDKNINATQCIDILVNLIYLINQGETFSTQEKENLFFSVTKLAHSPDVELRRIIFLFLRHLQFDKSFSFILTGSLINEIQRSDILKAISFRIVGKVLDTQNIQNVEKLLKNVIRFNISLFLPKLLISAALLYYVQSICLIRDLTLRSNGLVKLTLS